MKMLLDTCAISDLQREGGSSRVSALIEESQSCDLFLSVITMGELAKGVALLDSGKKKTALTTWLTALEQNYAQRILPIETETALIWGELTAKAQARGKTVSVSDGLIAATAIGNGLHVMTRNVKDFAETGAMIINPWALT